MGSDELYHDTHFEGHLSKVKRVHIHAVVSEHKIELQVAPEGMRPKEVDKAVDLANPAINQSQNALPVGGFSRGVIVNNRQSQIVATDPKLVKDNIDLFQ